MARLEDVAAGNVSGLDPDFAAATLKKMGRYSPISMAVVVEQIKRGAKMTLPDVFKMEYKISQGFMDHGEFKEGVRALLIDKDNAPQWRHSSVHDVTQADVDFFFD